MARPKEFDPDVALLAAMEAFWERGFEATSLSDLTACTGVQKASLYATYGDKRALFLAALDRYQDLGFAESFGRLDSAPSPRAALEQIFARARQPKEGRKGCLCVNTAIEMAPHDADVRQRLEKNMQRAEAAVARALERSKELREVRADLDAKATARFLVTSLYGLYVAAKISPGAKRLDDVARTVLSVLGP